MEVVASLRIGDVRVMRVYRGYMGRTGCERRLRVVVGGGVVYLAAVMLAAVESRAQCRGSLHGGEVAAG